MSAITSVGNAARLPVSQTVAPPGGASREEARESPAEKAREQQSPAQSAVTARSPQRAGGGAAKASTSDQNRLRMLAGRHLTASQIAQQLGQSVSAVMSEAAAMGINLNAAASGASSAGNSGTPGIGANVSVKA